ncbi:hypothetical protein OBBRIDRAFT_594659 [Obba rivulosa]|uniref:Uncharacterized protein n=1 Tax=Obba rivulosa TaxID=1052685 RepID=A0A8E2AWP4_9APHY|nr:hypothetical protein OBBRIDRAFT_594659 [Obba rivulosa]
MVSATLGFAVRRRVSRPSSITPTTHVLARISSSGPIYRHRGVRWSSTVTAAESPKSILAPERSTNGWTTILTSLVQKEWDTRNKKYLTLVTSDENGHHKSLHWHTSPMSSPGVQVLMSKTDLIKDAIPAFTSLIDAVFVAAPRNRSDAQRLLKLLNNEPVPYALRMLLYHRGMGLLSSLLIEHDYPFHALHAAAAGFIQSRCSPEYLRRQNLASDLAARRHWAWISPLVKLEVELTGQTTAVSLNWVVTACMETGVHRTPEQVLDMFRVAKLRPNRYTYRLLAKLQLLGPPFPSSSDVNLQLHQNDVDTVLSTVPVLPLPPQSPTSVCDTGKDGTIGTGVSATVTTANILRSILPMSRIPSERQVLNHIKLIEGHPERAMLLRSLTVTEHLRSLTKYMVTCNHPRVALHIIAISHHLTRNCDIFRWLYRPLKKCGCWSTIPDFIELESRLTGTKTVEGVNLLLRSFVKRKIYKDPVEIRKIFEQAGVRPNDRIHGLLEAFAAMSSQEPSSPEEHRPDYFQRDGPTFTNDPADDMPLPSTPSVASAPVSPEDALARAVDLHLRSLRYLAPSAPSVTSAPVRDSVEPGAPPTTSFSSGDMLVKAVDLQLRSLRQLARELSEKDARWGPLAQELENVEALLAHDRAGALPLRDSETCELPESSRASAASGTRDSL